MACRPQKHVAGRRTAEYLRRTGLVVLDESMRRLYEEAAEYAGLNVNLMLCGESGVGKDCLAKYIHAVSPRADGPFLHLNCGAIPDSLLESELFGYESGAFTGSLRQGNRGIIEAADGGTLFLDEIGEMTPENQVKMLRFLETKQLTRVGATTSRTVDVRIISATNRNLEQLIRSHRFRKDLYYRISVIQVDIPPLRDRPADIKGLISAYDRQAATSMGIQKHFTEDAMEFLFRQDWLGNIRELQNFLEKLYATTPDKEITPELLSTYSFSKRMPEPPEPTEEHGFLPLREVLEACERDYITQVIAAVPNLTEAAGILDMNLSTLNRRKRELGIYKRRRPPK